MLMVTLSPQSRLCGGPKL